MGPWQRRRQAVEGGHRLTWLAIIMGLALVGLAARLFFVQITRHNFYAKAALAQHSFSAELKPTRGKILIQDSDGSLYPLATNRDLILIYAVPSEIKEAEVISQKLYEFFDQTRITKEIDDQLQTEEEAGLSGQLAAVSGLNEPEKSKQEAAIKAAYAQGLLDSSYQKSRQERRQSLLKTKQDNQVNQYRTWLNRASDPYQILAKRVEPDVAKQFHLSLVGGVFSNLKIDDLDIKNGHMIASDGQAVPLDGIYYDPDTYRQYPETQVAAHLLGFTAFDDSERAGQIGKHGNYGLEGFFDKELFGKVGTLTSDKGAGGLVIAQDRQYQDKQDGCDLILTIDRSIQFFVDKTLRAGLNKYKAESAQVVVLDPASGAILAMSSMPDFDPNRYNEIKDAKIFNNPVIFDQYEPGSVFKAVTMAAALDQGKVGPDTTYQDAGQVMVEGWPKPIKNSDFDTAGGHGKTNMVQVLESSLNTGAIFAMTSIGAETFAGYVKNFGFGDKTGIELEGESAGDISALLSKKIKPVSAATASFGQGISVTPLQMALAYGALANGGELMKPYLVKEVRCNNQATVENQPQAVRRVISRAAADQIKGMLVKVVENGHAKRAGVAGYYIAGKTGTAQVTEVGKKGYVEGKYNHTFIGLGPDDNPRFVVLVRLNNPRGFEYAESTAVPLAHDVIEFLLNYWQIPKSR